MTDKHGDDASYLRHSNARPQIFPIKNIYLSKVSVLWDVKDDIWMKMEQKV